MKILICGVGAIGSNLAELLAVDLKGNHEITILDRDVVEERNVTPGTQRYTPEQVGLAKIEALQYNIYKWHEQNVDIRGEEISEKSSSPFYSFDLVLDCFDNTRSRGTLQTDWQFSSSGTPLLHVGFSDEFTFAIEWAEHYKVPSDITSGFDICEMPGAAAFVTSVASLAALVVQEYLATNRKMEIVGGKFARTMVV